MRNGVFSPNCCDVTLTYKTNYGIYPKEAVAIFAPNKPISSPNKSHDKAHIGNDQGSKGCNQKERNGQDILCCGGLPSSSTNPRHRPWVPQRPRGGGKQGTLPLQYATSPSGNLWWNSCWGSIHWRHYQRSRNPSQQSHWKRKSKVQMRFKRPCRN
jgi:hypothetical protein